MDKLIVKGLGKPLDGEYDCDLVAMLRIGDPESLTNREGHRVKVMSGVRAGELMDALEAGDNDVMVALAAVILSRHGKTVNEEKLWDAPMESGLSFEMGKREQDEEDEGDPPAEPAETPETEQDSTSGGTSSVLTLANLENGQSLTGVLGSPMSVTSGQAT